MPLSAAPRLLIALALAIVLSACSARYQTPVAMGGDDDDAVCQSRGYVQGSPEYAACRKDRDVQRNAAIARADRRQRDLGEYMLNNPVRP
ncbi:hypothetical protein EDE08_11145 [Bradyrhizobium sp. R2.2-H]|jgi:hypothetical protein|uniref:hypothetical protein n=1 Tax=unclassified Bradyrhizobium TaxID=2631580 RepID=UPI00104C6E2F|nr:MULTISPECIES: hypothetical protein [unclassified Bradyrhizobium]TCU66489.1 hypothetical protein EDE10_11145 [Bradyrhizobium sp. Y-H1]TCU68638.1 hypothetical protein EDE08_11145 [Bradyrhizobium sp. R2.2-H]